MVAYDILLVDDDPGVRKAVGDWLKLNGHDVHVAKSGAEALAVLKEWEPDILISDLDMPEMDGLELVHRTKVLRPLTVPIILTGSLEREDTIAAIKEGVFDFIEKGRVALSDIDVVLRRAGERAAMLKERDELLRQLKEQNERLEAGLEHIRKVNRELQRQDASLRADLARAQHMQEHMLPRDLPPIGTVTCFGYYRPCDLLGGDFFDRINLNEGGHSALYLADVSGHGVSAAMVTVVLREMIQARLRLREGHDIFARPDELLAFLNRGLCDEDFDTSVHVTMGYAVIDSRAQTVRYASAGHPPPLLCAAAGCRVADVPQGPALGMARNASYTVTSLPLSPCTGLLMYSDGVTGALDRQGAELGLERLARNLAADDTICTAHALGKRVEKLLTDHLRDTSPFDDISFIAVARRPDGQPVPAEPTVEFVTPRAYAARKPPRGARIETGESATCFVVRIVGKATWRQGKPFQRAAAEAAKAGKPRVVLELTDCEGLDSTMLGLVLRAHAGMEVYGLPEKPRAQLREVGVLPTLRLTNDPPPPMTFTTVPLDDANGGMSGQLILSAHEQLSDVSEENRRKFEGVVEQLRKEVKPT